MKTKLIVGLGNCGVKYENTRHNWGFVILDRIAQVHNFPSATNKFKALITTQKLNDYNVILLKPMTYMNSSGIAVIQCANFYKVNINDVIVIHDDLDLPLSRIKIKKGGGSGGHNGLKSIDKMLGIEYIRLRLGIDKPLHKSQVSDYVLHDFNSDEKGVVNKVNDFIATNFLDLLEARYDKLMNNYAISKE